MPSHDGDEEGDADSRVRTEEASVTRRNVLAGVGATPVAVSGYTDWLPAWGAVQDADGDQSDEIFFDNWENGSYTPEWEIRSQSDQAYGTVMEEDIPIAGEHALTVINPTEEVASDEVTARTTDTFRWDGEWTLETICRIETDEIRQQVWQVNLADEGLLVTLGFSAQPQFDPESELLPQRDVITDIEWEPGDWCHVQCYHDGTGVYSLKAWKEGDEEPSGYQAEVHGDAPADDDYPIRLDASLTTYEIARMQMAYLVVEAGEGIDRDDDPSDGNGDDPDPEPEIEFHSCTGAELEGSFEAGDPVYASTVFDSGGEIGQTTNSDGFTFGQEVDAPFTGTVRIEIEDGADESDITENDGEIVLAVRDRGENGTILTGVTTDPVDYRAAGITHVNPDGESCHEDLENDDNNLFDVSITDSTDPVRPGETLEVEADIGLSEEAGTAEQTDIPKARLIVDGDEVDSEAVTLDDDWTATVNLSHEVPTDADEGTLSVRVEFLDAADESEVQVEEAAPLFDVTITDATDPVQPGETLEVEADIRLSEEAATAEQADVPQAYLFVDGDEVDSEAVTLDDDWTATVGLTYEVPTETAEGPLSVRVEFLDSADETEVQVEADPTLFDVTITSATDPVQPGGVLEVAADIQLSDTDAATQAAPPTAVLLVDGEEVDSEEVTLDDEWTATVQLTYDVPAETTAATLSVRVEFLDTADTRTVDVSVENTTTGNEEEPNGDDQPADNDEGDDTPPDADDAPSDGNDGTDDSAPSDGNDGTGDNAPPNGDNETDGAPPDGNDGTDDNAPPSDDGMNGDAPPEDNALPDNSGTNDTLPADDGMGGREDN